MALGRKIFPFLVELCERCSSVTLEIERQLYEGRATGKTNQGIGNVSLLFFVYSGIRSGSWISVKNVLNLHRTTLTTVQDWGPTFFSIQFGQGIFLLTGIQHLQDREGKAVFLSFMCSSVLLKPKGLGVSVSCVLYSGLSFRKVLHLQ